MLKKFLQTNAEKINLTFDAIQLEKFETFYRRVIEWNEKINLTAITDEKEFAIKHIIDSLTIFDEKIFAKVKKIIDVGTGAGFPGIPIKIFCPEVEIILLDSLAKRVEFLKKIVEELEIKKVACIHGRAEDFAKQKTYREQFDLATSRAVARLNILSEYCLPFVKIGGKFIAMKGKNFSDEVTEATNAIKILGGGEIKISKKILPEIMEERAIIYVEKISSTQKKYPRKAGTPVKNPLA